MYVIHTMYGLHCTHIRVYIYVSVYEFFYEFLSIISNTPKFICSYNLHIYSALIVQNIY